MTAVVFLDVSSPQLVEHIRVTAAKSFGSVRYIDVTTGPGGTSFEAAWHSRYGGASLYASPLRAELDDVRSTFVCFVTETQTIEHADTAFAVFVAEVPTLLLSNSAAPSSLLHTTADSSASSRCEAIESFFAAGPHTPEVVVIEGGDGAGKETQTGLLVSSIREGGREVHTLDFPYEKGLYGGLVRAVLSGKKGSISELNPQLFSFLYSLNRFGCARQLYCWLRRGSAVVLDRYYTANFGHQASKLPPGEREAFIDELEFTEVGWLRLPRATTVLYLDLPPAAALAAMQSDSTRQQLDIHETAGGDYKEKVRQTYMWCCANLPGWHRVACFSDDGHRLTREAVHSAITHHLHRVGSQSFAAV